jgi:hypothetical protein
MFNRIATVTNPGDSVMLPPAQPGCDIMVLNVGGNQMTVYGLQTLSNGSITASTTHTQAGATPITTMFSRVVTANSGDGVRLPPAQPGCDLMVLNVSGNPINVYGSNQDQIDGNGAGNPVSQMNNGVVLYTCYSLASSWASEGLSTGFAFSGLQTFSNSAITASTTHTQAGATPITTMQAAVTVNNASDSVILPPSAPGLQIDVANLSASLAGQIYASGSDTINGTAGSTGIALAANAVTLFFCFQAGKWLTK